MKCPYRIAYIEKRDEDLTDYDGYIITEASVKHELYEECYGTECPFYDSTFKKCLRVVKELK